MAMTQSIEAGKNAVATKRIGLVSIATLSGLLWVSAQVRSQAQPIQPVRPMQPNVAGLSEQSSSTKSTSSQGTTTKKTAAAARPPYDRALLRPALLRENAPELYKVKFTTTRGDFTVTVTRAWAPLGADRFFNLVKHHFYDNASVFRVVPGFVAQFGISSYPNVAAAWQRAEVKDDPVTQSNKKGYVSFATAGPNTRTTQVFINLKDNSGLDGRGFAPFGVVDADGMKVVDMFYDQYGDSAGIDQGQIERQGKAYLDKSFPKLDTIKTAVITEPANAAGPIAGAKPAGTASKSGTATKKPQ
jgi:peptidyl-prolyl cis-trans isomerase A (cyclophilin A)